MSFIHLKNVVIQSDLTNSHLTNNYICLSAHFDDKRKQTTNIFEQKKNL